MSIAGVILGIIAMVASVLGLLTGLLGGAVAGVLALLAILFGILAKRREQGKGVPAIVIGVIAVLLAIALAVCGIDVANRLITQARLYKDQAPTVYKYAEKINPNMGILALINAVPTKEESDLLVKELQNLPTSGSPAPTEAPAAE